MENAAWNGNHAALHGFLLEAAQDRDGRHYWKVCLTEYGRHHCLESGYEDNLAAARRSAEARAAAKSRQYAEAAAWGSIPSRNDSRRP